MSNTIIGAHFTDVFYFLVPDQEYTEVDIVNETGNSSVIYHKRVRQTRGVNFMGKCLYYACI